VKIRMMQENWRLDKPQSDVEDRKRPLEEDDDDEEEEEEGEGEGDIEIEYGNDNEITANCHELIENSPKFKLDVPGNIFMETNIDATAAAAATTTTTTSRSVSTFTEAVPLSISSLIHMSIPLEDGVLDGMRELVQHM
jgi:hypothetical protein